MYFGARGSFLLAVSHGMCAYPKVSKLRANYGI
jgi:hypothetical protein